MRRFLPALLLLPRLAAADPPKLTLDQVIAKAIANPRVQQAIGDREAAEGKLAEADAARYPRVKGTAFATISPRIQCHASAPDPTGKLCLTTEPTNFAFEFSGLYGTAEVDVTQPLYTFGKIEHARSAARAGLDAERALADEAAGDVAIDAARAYWGLKLAREMGGMLDDGIDEIEKAQKDFEAKKDASIQDKERVAVLLAQAKAQRAEAAEGEAKALAGLRAVTGIPDADIDDAEIAPVDHPLPDEHALAAGALRRPQSLAAASGAKAADELADYQEAQYYPDVAIVGSAVISGAQGVDNPPTAFAWDPYRREGVGLGIGLQWTLEPWNIAARTDQARAAARKMHAQAELARLGATYDAQTALADATAAHDKVAAAAVGEKSARTWLAAVLQDQAIGTAEARDLADAYLAWFQMRAAWAQAVFDWNVAVVTLERDTGEYRADDGRPR